MGLLDDFSNFMVKRAIEDTDPHKPPPPSTQAQILSALQGASNAAASNLSAPVDGIAWLLRKAGLPIPPNPVGGSDWMAQKGLTREPQIRNMGLLGEALGGVAPMVAAAKAPQIARGLLQAGENLAAPATNSKQLGAIVWHGSPHKFDKFDASKIGTGEGAQAYGHGIYMAESPEVALSYQKALAPEKRLAQSLNDRMQLVKIGDRPLDSFGVDMSQELIDAAKNGGQEFLDLAHARKARWEQLSQDASYPFKDYAAEKIGAYDNLINAAKSQGAEYTGAGNLYKIDLPDEHIARMLDWDKPLSQQPQAVRDAVANLAQHPSMQDADLQAWLKSAGDKPGSAVYKQFGMSDGLANPNDISSVMRQAGIPGIRYLDGGSRGAGAGTSNFVIFPQNEHLATILERNGVPINGLLAP